MTTRELANGAMPDLRFAVLGAKGHTQQRRTLGLDP